jgi:3-phosphoshikimate 1-carboxyvinyltransferase
MKIEATARSISGSVNAPSSKSAMQRYVAGALLAEGTSRIFSPSFCDDSVAAIKIAEALGAGTDILPEYVKIKGGFNPVSGEIFCGESGLATRMFTPIAALHDQEIIINGKGSILSRPLDMMESSLTELGAEIRTNNGFLPVRIRGPLKGGIVHTDGSVSSQFLTGLLMALPVVNNDSTVYVEKLVSKPYIDLTLRVLEDFGIVIKNNNYSRFEIKGNQKFRPGDYKVEGDWSGGAFLLVMAAIAGEATVKNLDIFSAQADKAIFEVISRAGSNISMSGDCIIVSKGNLNAFSYDISDCPDLAPPMVILALACKGKSIITGTNRLVSKESDRGKALEMNISLLGGKITNFTDRIEIEGGNLLHGGIVHAGNDHRIAMAMTAASLISNAPVIIDGMECINKSYPDFIGDFMKLGGETKQL